MDPSLLYLKNSKHPLYDEIKALFLFHSNKIEGSTFSLEQLELLITKNEISGTHDFDDVIETRNSLDVFDYVIDTAGEPLSLFLLREYHALLKKSTRDERYGFAGKFKTIPNKLSHVDLELAQPYEVEEKLTQLIEKYSGPMNIEDITVFHKEFEVIHPFIDGNGRIGRFLVIKQCIENNIDFLLIDEKNEHTYKQALFIAQKDNDINPLVLVFKDSQAEFAKQANEFIKLKHEYKNIIDSWYNNHFSMNQKML